MLSNLSAKQCIPPTWAIVAALFLPLIGSGTAIAETPTASARASNPPLYLHQAKHGSLQRQGDQWVLTLRGSAPSLTTFAGQPQRVGSPHELNAFVSGWSGIFGDAKPQAALEITDAPAHRDVILLELSPPVFGGKSGTVNYTVRPLAQTSRATLAALAERADGSVPGHFGRASLYIDATGGGAHFQVYWTSNGGTFGMDFDAATISSATLMSSFTEGNYIYIGPTGIDGQSFNPTGLFQGSIQGELTLPPTGPLTGIATVPSGFTLQLTLCNGTPVTLANGTFSVPVPAEGC
ncbi:MAG: hypothetical protein PHT19_10735 [Methylococcus sp.]|nr:hypothetical protein [Methylococcus sp.]